MFPTKFLVQAPMIKLLVFALVSALAVLLQPVAEAASDAAVPLIRPHASASPALTLARQPVEVALTAAQDPGPVDDPTPAIASPFRCPMLYYHEVGSRSYFAAQIAAFLSAGYRPIALGRVVDALESRSELPPKCLVLTFDDGLASQISNALPVLLQYAVPATFFVMPAGFQDGVHRYMTSDDFRTLRDSGLEVGSHTLNHASLPALLRFNLGAFQAELVLSKAWLERELGRTIDLFAYPNGAWDPPTVEEVRKAGYRAAASTLPGTIQPPEALYTLRRLPASSGEAPATILARIRG